MRALDVPGKSPKAIPELSENVRTLHSKLAPSDDDYIDVDEVELALELDDLKDLEDNN
jgi:hypothetical protein